MASDQANVKDKTEGGFHPMQFIDETRREISKVTWPTRKETVGMTVAIVLMAIVTGLFFFGVDSVLGFVVSRVLGMNS
ncbi:MAG TPA: preprotein translocase subunit SecE [Alphaproteobacteria bacterium]|nr:preprotein translocase subunit SecE [Alphaproteobacteria bacterium]